MPQRLFDGPFQSFKSGGAVNAAGTVTFKEANTSDDKDTYSDYQRSSTNANPVVLDSEGRADIYLGDGFYDVTIKNSDGDTISTMEDVTAEATTTETAGANLLLNGSFETATDGTNPDNWTITAYTNGTVERVSTSQSHGTYAMKFTSTGSGGGYIESDFIPVSALRQLTISWIMVSSVADVQNDVEFYWYDSSKVALTGGSAKTSVYSENSANPTSYTLKTANATPPSTAYWAKVRMTGCNSADATSGNTHFDSVVVSGEAQSAPSIYTAAKTSAYDIGANLTDLSNVGELFCPVDASGGDVTITLPAASEFPNQIIKVFASVNPAGNSVIVNNNAASEIYTGYALYDFVRVVSDGTNVFVIDERVTVRGTQAFTDDLSIAATSTYYKKTSGYAVDTDVGDWFDSSTNHRIDAAFDCTLLLFVDSLTNDNDTRVQVRVNNTAIQDLSAPGFTFESQGVMSQAWSLSLDATDYVEVYFGGNATVSSSVVNGDAAKDEAKIYWEVIRRRR
jgi:hypothetical protein